jgi:hypothetical protein
MPMETLLPIGTEVMSGKEYGVIVGYGTARMPEWLDSGTDANEYALSTHPDQIDNIGHMETWIYMPCYIVLREMDDYTYTDFLSGMFVITWPQTVSAADRKVIGRDRGE